MARLDWEKARQKERNHGQPPINAAQKRAVKRRAARKQELLSAFVAAHHLSCFKCGATKAEWAKTGLNKRGFWAICSDCVVSKRPAV